MANIKAVVRAPRADGFCTVYIRVTQGSNSYPYHMARKRVASSALTSALLV